ncbi:hypothetical protein [Pseudomonas putida]|uniref:hypothetical protein n=1 Tax=Pseudomonas putida TaxID=303 RepID=UPI000379DC1F|nr:hypothetical protein [Pseudomonas putida]ANC80082.1 hypothetical protein KKK_03290 [Pseudomonas putida B6-2]
MALEPGIFSVITNAILKPLADLFLGRWKNSKAKAEELERFYLELSDVRDKAVEAIRILAEEHNRRNDPYVRAGRRWDRYGPISSPSRIEFFAVRSIFTSRYGDFTAGQRQAFKQVLEFADAYNEHLARLNLLHGEHFDKFDWGFAIQPIGTLASMAFLLAKMVELRERFHIKDSETSTSAVQAVLSAYQIALYDVEFEEAE